MVAQGELTWNEEEEFEVEQILGYAEEDVSCFNAGADKKKFYLFKIESICRRKIQC